MAAADGAGAGAAGGGGAPLKTILLLCVCSYQLHAARVAQRLGACSRHAAGYTQHLCMHLCRKKA
jgi:hypothetical protein